MPSAPLDPTTLKNFRTAAFDLDSVYGQGRTAQPEQPPVRGRQKHFKVTEEEDQVNGVPDLARNANGGAILIEPRNDENLIIAQLHLAVQKFHNRLIDEGANFNDARRLTQWHYQWVVVNDYLPHVVGQDRVNMFLGKPVTNGFYKPGNPAAPMTPTEFSTAVFRYGHSQVRDSYEVNDLSEDAPIKVFDLTRAPRTCAAASTSTSDTHIDWIEFFEIDGAPEFEGNLSRKLDTKISESLFNLPLGAPGLPSAGTNILAQLTLIRSSRYDIPSGQDIARQMGIPVLANNKLGLNQSAYPSFNGEAPLWFYMLAESELKENGAPSGCRRWPHHRRGVPRPARRRPRLLPQRQASLHTLRRARRRLHHGRLPHLRRCRRARGGRGSDALTHAGEQSNGTVLGHGPVRRVSDRLTVGSVEPRGLEPLTPCLQSRCATNCAMAPSWHSAGPVRPSGGPGRWRSRRCRSPGPTAPARRGSPRASCARSRHRRRRPGPAGPSSW